MGSACGRPRQGRGGRVRALAGRSSLGWRLDGQDAGRLFDPGLPEGDGRRGRDAGPNRRRHLLRQPHRRRQRRFRVSVGAAALLRPALRFGAGAHAGQRAWLIEQMRLATSGSPRPGCRPSAKWSAWPPRPWATANVQHLSGRSTHRQSGRPLPPRRRERRRLRRGARQWTAPWGNHGGNDFINIFPHRQYA